MIRKKRWERRKKREGLRGTKGKEGRGKRVGEERRREWDIGRERGRKEIERGRKETQRGREVQETKGREG